MARFDVALEINKQQTTLVILTALAIKLNQAAIRAKPRIQAKLVSAVETAILASPEALSLQGGRLQGELGVVNPEEAIHAVIATLQKNIVVNLTPFFVQGDGLGGGLAIGISRRDMSDLLALPEGKFVSEGGYDIPWLKWLLTTGDEILVPGYHFQGGNYFDRSRTGLGIMEKKGGWEVPLGFRGTLENNWITRALVPLGSVVNRILREEIR